MRIYGPSDILHAAGTVRQGFFVGTEHVKELIDLIPRVIDLVERIDAVVDRVEQVVDKTDAVVTQAAASRAKVDQVAQSAESLLQRTETLLGDAERVMPAAIPVAERGLPILEELVNSIDPNEVAAMKGIIDRMPNYLDEMDQMAPDVRNILDAITDLSHAVQGMPGMGMFQRRGERKKDSDENPEIPTETGTAQPNPPVESQWP